MALEKKIVGESHVFGGVTYVTCDTLVRAILADFAGQT